METKFENHYVRDKEWANDIFSYISFRRPIHIVIYILSALSLGIGIYNLIVYYYLQIVLFLVPVIWGGLLLYIYFKNKKATMKRDIELHGKAIEVDMYVTDEAIEMKQSTGSVTTLKYADIKKVVRTSKFYYVWSKSNMLYTFKKSGFSKGNAEEFLSFLRDKGIKC